MFDIKTRETKNDVYVIGQVVSKNIVESQNDKGNYIRGSITVASSIEVDGEVVETEIPVSFFAYEKKKNGEHSSLYDRIKSYGSFVARNEVDDPKDADYISLRGSISESNFVSKNTGNLVNAWQIRTSFINKVPASSTQDAHFDLDGVVICNMKHETNKNEEETGRLIITGALVGWQGRVDILNFIVSNPTYVNAIESYWHVNDTVRILGDVIETSKTTEYEEAVGFGEPIKHQSITTIRELLVNNGSREPYDEDRSYDIDSVKIGLEERKARLDALVNGGSKPAPKKSLKETLGF